MKGDNVIILVIKHLWFTLIKRVYEKSLRDECFWYVFKMQDRRKQSVSGPIKKHNCTYKGGVTAQLQCVKHTSKCKAWAF